MLLQKQKELPYISVFKMPSGEEFLCKVIEETATHYVVSKPLTLGQTATGFKFIPVMMLADPEKNVTIPKPVMTGEPTANLESQYETMVSGIALPQKSAIIT